LAYFKEEGTLAKYTCMALLQALLSPAILLKVPHEFPRKNYSMYFLKHCPRLFLENVPNFPSHQNKLLV
jgi:hypothetical protein